MQSLRKAPLPKGNGWLLNTARKSMNYLIEQAASGIIKEMNIKGQKRSKMLRLLDVLFDSLTFVSIQYLLLCCMYSFRASIAYIFFFALNISVISKHWANLKNALPDKIIFISVFVLNFIVLGSFMLIFGYLEISPVLKKAF